MPSEHGGCCAHGASWEQGNAVLGQPVAVGSPDEPIPLPLPQVLRPVKYKQFKLNFKKGISLCLLIYLRLMSAGTKTALNSFWL